MHQKTIEELEQEYDLELDKIITKIKKAQPKTVLLQFPDGLKPYSITILDEIKKSTKNTEFFIWIGSCFGACDIPNVKDIDLLIQFGHSPWKSK